MTSGYPQVDCFLASYRLGDTTRTSGKPRGEQIHWTSARFGQAFFSVGLPFIEMTNTTLVFLKVSAGQY